MKHSFCNAVVTIIVLGIVGLHVPEADARGRVRLRGAGLARGTHHSGPVLSRDQLRACVGQQDTLNAEGKQLDGLETLLKAQAAHITALEAKIAREEPLVDRYSQKSVDSFNALITKQKRLVAAHNGNLPEYNTKVDKHMAEQRSFNSKCAGHAYYESDMQAVRANP